MRPTAVLLALAGAALALPFNGTIDKRQSYSDERLTWYDPAVGTGACGLTYQNTDYVVAMNGAQYNSGLCFKDVTITVNGRTATAEIVDLCPGCPYGGLDLSEGLFDFFTWAGAAGSSTDPGVLSGDWYFN